MAWSKKYKKSIDCNNPKGFSQKAHCAGRKKRESIMKLSEFKTEVRKIVQERSINAIAKQQQKVADGIAKALELYKKVKDDKESKQYKKAIDALRKLNDEKKKLEKEMDVAVSSKMRNVGLSDKFESVNEMDPYIKPVKKDDEEEVEEGFASDAQRRAAFASGYKAKGKKGKKKNESVNEAIKYNKDGFVTKMENEAGKVVKDITLDGEKFVLKGNKYVSKKGGKDLHKSHFGIKESINEVLVIVDKFDKKRQDYGKIYYKDGGNRPGDGDIKKANKELAKLSKKHKGLTLVSVGRNSKMYDVNNPRESVNESFFVMYQKKGVFGKPAAVKYKDKKTAEKFAKDLERDGYNTMILDRQTMRNVKGVKVTEAKNKESKAIQVMHKYSKTERKFYDKLADHERRIGPRDYKKFIEKALRGFGLNPSKFKTIPDAEEKMYQIAVKESISEDLRKWFGKGKTGSSTGGGWDRYGSDGQKLGKCGDGKKGGAYAACLSKEKAAKLGAKGRASFVRRKRADQKKAGDAKKGGNRSKGKKPTFSKTGT